MAGCVPATCCCSLWSWCSLMKKSTHRTPPEGLCATMGMSRHSIAETAEPLPVALLAQHAFSRRLSALWHTPLPFHHEASDSHILGPSDCMYTSCTSFRSRDRVQISGATPAGQGCAELYAKRKPMLGYIRPTAARIPPRSRPSCQEGQDTLADWTALPRRQGDQVLDGLCVVSTFQTARVDDVPSPAGRLEPRPPVDVAENHGSVGCRAVPGSESERGRECRRRLTH